MEEVVQDEEMSDIPQNVLSVNLNDINNNIDIQMSDDYNDAVHSENVNINMNFIEPNNNNHDSHDNDSQNSNKQNPQNNN